MLSQMEIKKSLNAAVSANVNSEATTPTILKYECELCLESYNVYDRKPYSLVPCGHSLCIKCFESLTKTVCPYCRCGFTSKIPNWEIVKRLPKPTIPIVYYQLEKKLNALNKLSADYGKCIADVNADYNDKIGKLIAVERVDVKTKTKPDVAGDGGESNQPVDDQQFNERVKKLAKRFEENHAHNTDIETNLTKKLEKFKTQMDMDEIKYNEESLKKMKSDIDKLNTNIGEKIKLLKREQDTIDEIFAANSNQKPDVTLAKLENEIFKGAETTSAYEQIYRELNAIFNTNVVRPMSETSINQSSDMNNENEEMFNCRQSQKIIVVTIITILTFLIMIYPMAMIVIGALNTNECLMNYLIPIWLIVGGCGGILSEIFGAAILIYSLLRAIHHRTFREKLLQIFLLVIPFVIIIIFNLAWFFTGNAWIYPSYKSVQFTDKNSPTTYCNQTVFLFAFWTLNFAYILFGILLLIINLICCCVCFMKK